MSNRSDGPLTLVLLAAGVGSRYGGLKQIEGFGPGGETIMEYSIFDAVRAGFKRVVFVIRPEMESVFRETIGSKIGGKIEARYVYQKIDALAGGYTVPEGRTKPWGTGQALLSAAAVVDGPFIAANADDFYGRSAYGVMGEFLEKHRQPSTERISVVPDSTASATERISVVPESTASATERISVVPESTASATERISVVPEAAATATYAMVGYRLRDTLSELGTVSRGVCHCDADGWLKSIVEMTKIERRGNDAVALGEGPPVTERVSVVPGASATERISVVPEGSATERISVVPEGSATENISVVPGETLVSMNFWGFQPGFFETLRKGFERFLGANGGSQTAEYYLPTAVQEAMRDGARVKVLQSSDAWCGVTHKHDKSPVENRLRELVQRGEYPARLWA